MKEVEAEESSWSKFLVAHALALLQHKKTMNARATCRLEHDTEVMLMCGPREDYVVLMMLMIRYHSLSHGLRGELSAAAALVVLLLCKLICNETRHGEINGSGSFGWGYV